MQKGGRLFYVGCGTSGRLGVLDASEIPPTFGMPHGVVVGVIAGGDRALRFATEGSEDDENQGKLDLENYDLNENDSVIGISAAGGARYVTGALKCAKDRGCLTACITSNENTAIGNLSDFTIITDTGAEAITGSTHHADLTLSGVDDSDGVAVLGSFKLYELHLSEVVLAKHIVGFCAAECTACHCKRNSGADCRKNFFQNVVLSSCRRKKQCGGYSLVLYRQAFLTIVP